MKMNTQTKEGNILIAKFDGWIFSKTGLTCKKKSSTYEPHTLRYHDKWEWIMPVVEKVNRIATDEDYDLSELATALCTVDIRGVWLQLISIIHYYNTTQEK